MNVTIREANESDLGRVLEIYRDSGLDRLRSLGIEEAAALFGKFAEYPRYKLYVAVADGEVLGTFALLIMDNLANGGLASGVIEDVAVAKKAQRQGVGRAMIAWAMDECRRQGCYKLSLSSSEIRTEAHKFYESLGFVRHGFSFKIDITQAGE
jgi:GNAT superfamily N-acetyltransferase